MRKFMVWLLIGVLHTGMLLGMAGCSMTAKEKHYDLKQRRSIKQDAGNIAGTEPFSLF